MYNSAHCLSVCLDSILSQEYTNFEVLLINDGSVDNTVDVCIQYEKIDSRVRLINKENAGVSSARNVGLAEALGEWVMFVDSDDWIYPNSLVELVSGTQGADLIAGAMYLEGSDSIMNLFEYDRLLEGRELELIIQNNINHSVFNSPCAKLFKTSIIKEKNLRFNESLCFGEDAIFVKNYLLNVDTLLAFHSPCYHYCDLGEGIYRKYSANFKPVHQYFLMMLSTYDSLSNKFNISIKDRELVGVVFNIALNNIKEYGNKDKLYLRQFFTNERTRYVLKNRGSVYINIILLLASLETGLALSCFVKVVEKIKAITKSFLK